MVTKEKCPYCGSLDIIRRTNGTMFCNNCGNEIVQDAKARANNITANIISQGADSVDYAINGEVKGHPGKSVITAAVLAAMFGSFGADYFYLGQYGKGVLSILFSWTCIPGILGIIRCILYILGK